MASEVHDLLVKTHPADLGKIAEIKALVWEYLFIDRILGVATSAADRRLTGRAPIPAINRGCRVRSARAVNGDRLRRRIARAGPIPARGPSTAYPSTIAPTSAIAPLAANIPWIPTAPAIVPPTTDPKIVASPALAENSPWAVPPSDVGSLAASTVTPPTKAQANPSPSSGAISTSAMGSIDDRRQGRPEHEHERAEDHQPLRPEPCAQPRKGVHQRDLDDRPERPGDADQAGVPAQRHDLDRVEGIDRGERRPHDREADEEQEDPGRAAGSGRHRAAC